MGEAATKDDIKSVLEEIRKGNKSIEEKIMVSRKLSRI